VVDAVEVVVAEVALELTAECAVAWVEVASEGWPPALVVDRLVKRFDVAIGLRAAGVDVGDAGAEPLDGLVEALAAVLSCQIAPAVPRKRPTEKQSTPTSSPGRSTSMCGSGCGSRGGS